MLGLLCCTRAFSSCSELGATLPCSAQASYCGGIPCWGAKALSPWASGVVALGFSSCSFLAPESRLTHGHSCLTACGVFQEQGLYPHPLNWQADSSPLDHQGSLDLTSEAIKFIVKIIFQVNNKMKINHSLQMWQRGRGKCSHIPWMDV